MHNLHFPRLVIRNKPRKMLNSQPLLSVVIPVYNRPEKVLQAISSALNAIECAQKTKHFSSEILVIDDGSDIPLELGKLGSQCASCSIELRVIRSDQNGGVGKARNLGMANASGRYLSFLDSDDIYLDNRFGGDLEFMTHYAVEFCYGTTQDVRASNLDWNAPCGRIHSHVSLLRHQCLESCTPKANMDTSISMQ